MTRQQMEQRRFKAARMLMEGASQSDLCRALKVSRMTASRWDRLFFTEPKLLKRRKATGRPPQMDTSQAKQVFVPGMTGRQFSDAIYDKFGVRFDEDHCYRIIHKLGLRDKRKYAPR